MAQLIYGLEEITDRYDGFIIDLFGVIHNGIKLYPQTIDTLTRLQEQGKAVCFLSNSPRLEEDAGDQCLQMGLPEPLLPSIVTSGEASHKALEEFGARYGKNCWFISSGMPELHSITQNVDITFLDGPEGADFILNSIPGTETTEKEKLLAQFGYASECGLPMICANPDLVVHIGDTLHECAGTFAKIYEEIGGDVTYFGKPYLPVYEAAQQQLGGLAKDRICAIGDSFHTDIQGANNFGIDSLFNLVGIHREELGSGNIETGLQDLINKQAHKPVYVIEGFKW